MHLNSVGDILIIDLEATCWPEGNKGKEMEIIEIGAVLCRMEHFDRKGYSLNVVDEGAWLVRPEINPILTPFCTGLTTITQDMLEKDGMSLATALTELKSLMYNEPLFASWGQFDQDLFMRESRRKYLPYPFINYLNLKMLFAKRTGKDLMGEDEALHSIGLPFSGTRHRGIDDARNSVNLLRFLIDREMVGK